MGSRVRRMFLPLVVSVLLVVPAGTVLLLAEDAAAQGSNQSAPSPEKLWSFPAGATVNGVSMDATGKVAAAVQADVGAADFGDDELFIWDLARNPNSSTPALQDDPSPQPVTGPEGLGVVAVEPRPGGKANLVAVGREGTGDADNQIYVYDLSRGPDTASSVSYMDEAPPGPVEELWFTSTGNWLLARHGGQTGALSLFERTSGTQFEEHDTFTPDSGTLQDVDVSRDGSRILAALSGDVQDSTTIELVVFERKDVDDDKNVDLARVTNPETRERSSAQAVVALDKTGRFALLGTGDDALFYYEIQEENATDDDDRDWNFSAAWSFRGPDAVTSLDLTPSGEIFAAGFDDGSLIVFEQTDLPEEGPLAARAVESGFDTGKTVTQAEFQENGQRLLATAGALYGFHARQFDPNQALEPLWTITDVTSFASSTDGHRMVVATSNGVTAYEQAYRADVRVDAPDEIRPGETTSVNVAINNTGSSFDDYRLSTRNVPSSWTIGFDRTQLGLLPGQGDTVTMNVTPSKSQAPTDVSFEVVATSTRAPSERAAGTASVSVTVPEVRAAGLATDTDRVEGTRGQTATIEVELSNNGNTEADLRLEIDQDEDWTVAIDDESTDARTFTLDAAASQNVTIGLDVPESAEEGSVNEITIEAQPTASGDADEVSVEILVEPSFGATLSLPSGPVDAEVGRPSTLDLGVRNTGNTPDTFSLRVYSNATEPSHLWRASLANTQVEVEPGSNETVQVTVDVPRGAATGEATDLTIVARSTTTGDKVDETSVRLRIPEDTDESPMGLVLAPLAIALAAAVRRRRT